MNADDSARTRYEATVDAIVDAFALREEYEDALEYQSRDDASETAAAQRRVDVSNDASATDIRSQLIDVNERKCSALAMKLEYKARYDARNVDDLIAALMKATRVSDRALRAARDAKSSSTNRLESQRLIERMEASYDSFSKEFDAHPNVRRRIESWGEQGERWFEDAKAAQFQKHCGQMRRLRADLTVASYEFGDDSETMRRMVRSLRTRVELAENEVEDVRWLANNPQVWVANPFVDADTGSDLSDARDSNADRDGRNAVI